MDIPVLLFSCFVIILALGILRNWKVKSPIQNTFSILIACRNEEKNLPQLFDSLQKLDYPVDKFEIIIVDDASTDNSTKLINDFCKNFSYMKSIILEEKSVEFKGKKAALKAATDVAVFEFLLFTDADCILSQNWIENYNSYISKNTGMIISSYKEINTSRFQKFCNQASTAIYACTTGIGFPFSGAGGNMCVRKNAFEEVGGYNSIKHNEAGDDKQIVNLIAKTDWQIRYNPCQDVVTENNSKLKHHGNQRKYGKFWMSSPFFKIISVLIFLFYIYLPISVFVANEWSQFSMYYFSVLFFWLMNLLKHKLKFNILDPIYILYYPFYVIFYSLLGMRNKWKWKS
jgi:poly-beta-1,6-N-acetyl-D-glucosamine synthase